VYFVAIVDFMFEALSACIKSYTNDIKRAGAIEKKSGARDIPGQPG
jgi:hypothetical protein